LLYAQTNRMQDALNDFNKAITLKQYPKAYVARANVYYTLQDFPKAILDAQTVLQKDPTNVKANYVLATSYDDLNELDKALSYYNVVIKTTNDNPGYFLRRAILYGKKQQFNACLTDLDICTTLDATFAEAYYWKGVAKVNMNQSPCNDLKKAVDLGFRSAASSLKNYCH